MTQTQNKKMFERINVTWNYTEGIIVSADVKSRSRPGLVHYSRIVLDPLSLKVRKETCDCEGRSFGRKCWHLKALEEMIENDKELRKEINKVSEEMLKIEEDIASWG